MAQVGTDLLRTIRESMGGGPSGFARPSFYDQYGIAQRGLDALGNVVDGTDFSQNDWLRAQSMLNAQKGQAIAGGALAGLQGLTSIAGIASGMADINQVPEYQLSIDNIGRLGTDNYSSYDQIASGYDYLNKNIQDFDYDKIRGGSTTERIGSTLSSGLSGASAGLQIGGPVGALVGGLAGLGAGAIGWITGNERANAEQARLKTEQKVAQGNAIRNLNAANNQVSDYQFRSGISHRVAYGGKIERKEETVKEFADRILKTQKNNDVTHSSGIIRKHCKGGTMIRIKR